MGSDKNVVSVLQLKTFLMASWFFPKCSHTWVRDSIFHCCWFNKCQICHRKCHLSCTILRQCFLIEAPLVYHLTCVWKPDPYPCWKLKHFLLSIMEYSLVWPHTRNPNKLQTPASLSVIFLPLSITESWMSKLSNPLQGTRWAAADRGKFRALRH